MLITYLGHSGFLAETDQAYFLFDYIRGDLPVLSPDKPLYVFASHAHHDHWIPEIFTDPRLKKARAFLLGFDIEAPFEKLAVDHPSWRDLPIIWAQPGQAIKTDLFSCVPLLSTDEGVAFPVQAEKETIYHAGDLNWWHWNGDPADRNRERGENFKREIDRIKDLAIDVAFVPLDPRQEDAYRLCMDYCMERLHACHVIPMHLWEKYDLCLTYREDIRQRHPDWYDRFVPVAGPGQTFLF